MSDLDLARRSAGRQWASGIAQQLGFARRAAPDRPPVSIARILQNSFLFRLMTVCADVMGRVEPLRGLLYRKYEGAFGKLNKGVALALYIPVVQLHQLLFSLIHFAFRRIDFALHFSDSAKRSGKR